MNKCVCGNTFRVDAGDTIRNGVYAWYASYRCGQCGESMEVDGYGIDSIPDDVKALIIERKGEWGLRSSASQSKAKYLLNKILQYGNIDSDGEILFVGTQSQVEWVKYKLVKRGITENELTLKNMER